MEITAAAAESVVIGVAAVVVVLVPRVQTARLQEMELRREVLAEQVVLAFQFL
jgi:hypothetical protein